jgi:hypothetical protein
MRKSPQQSAGTHRYRQVWSIGHSLDLLRGRVPENAVEATLAGEPAEILAAHSRDDVPRAGPFTAHATVKVDHKGAGRGELCQDPSTLVASRIEGANTRPRRWMSRQRAEL